MQSTMLIKHFLLSFLLFTSIVTKAQVGIGITTPAASAQLDVSSTSKGFLPPRMDSTQRNAIVSPAAGLIIYNTTISALQIYSGSTWYTASAATTMGAIGGSSSTNGGTITAAVLSLTPADLDNGGIVTTSAQTFAGNKIFNGNVGIGTAPPPAKLSVLAGYSEPSIPGTSSAGVFRIGVASNDGMDFGKSSTAPYPGWIQNGFNGTDPDPLSLNPLGGNVGIGTITPAASAQLDVSSTTKGFLPPRMSNTQRNAISSPVSGLMIWNTDDIELQVYNGSLWVNMIGTTNQTLAIGQNYKGGKVAYILVSGDPGYDANTPHGLIAATSDQSTGIKWGITSNFFLTGATGTAIGTGLSNTNTIIAFLGPSTSYAAHLARAYKGGGYTDWYLPSKGELAKLYAMKVLGFGGFANEFYWSSTEFDGDDAWLHYFGANGQADHLGKFFPNYVRAVRAF